MNNYRPNQKEEEHILFKNKAKQLQTIETDKTLHEAVCKGILLVSNYIFSVLEKLSNILATSSFFLISRHSNDGPSSQMQALHVICSSSWLKLNGFWCIISTGICCYTDAYMMRPSTVSITHLAPQGNTSTLCLQMKLRLYYTPYYCFKVEESFLGPIVHRSTKSKKLCM